MPQSRTFPFDPLTRKVSDVAETQGFVLDPDVPLPGEFSFRRVVRLDPLVVRSMEGQPVALQFRPVAVEDYAAQIDLKSASTGFTFNLGMAREFWRRQALAVGIAASAVEEALDYVADPSTDSDPRPRPRREDVVAAFASFLKSLSQGTIELPAVTPAGRATSRVVRPKPPTDPAFYIVEEYRVSAFATKYGFGRTIKTFSLLPGEETTIKVRVWRSSERTSSTSRTTSLNNTSSIIDSVDESAIDRFVNDVQKAVSDKKTRSSQEQWHVEGEVGGGVGFVHANVKAGGGGDYRSGQEDFANRVTQTVKEHAQEASRSRQNAVEEVRSTSDSSTVTARDVREDEDVVERRLRNINLRRVLNFVFRELNQMYEVFVHLTNMRIAYSSGHPGSWREVPPSQLKRLVGEVAIVNSDSDSGPVAVAESLPTSSDVALLLLQQISPVVDHRGHLVDTLECVLEGKDGSRATVPARRGIRMLPLQEIPITEPVPGLPPPPTTARVSYQFKQDALGQEDHNDGTPLVDGVVVGHTQVTMRTDTIVVEALLGFSDALDPFALESQELTSAGTNAANELRLLEGRKLKLALDTLENIEDPEKRADAFAKFFPPPAAPKGPTGGADA